jgi:hypothetical protein
VKPLDTVEVLLRIHNLLQTRALHLRIQGENELEQRVRRPATARRAELLMITFARQWINHASTTCNRLACAPEENPSPIGLQTYKPLGRSSQGGQLFDEHYSTRTTAPDGQLCVSDHRGGATV